VIDINQADRERRAAMLTAQRGEGQDRLLLNLLLRLLFLCGSLRTCY
jgi:hypothetical protein